MLKLCVLSSAGMRFQFQLTFNLFEFLSAILEKGLLTKEIPYIRIELISHRTGLRRQHGRRFVVLGTLTWLPGRHVIALNAIERVISLIN